MRGIYMRAVSTKSAATTLGLIVACMLAGTSQGQVPLQFTHQGRITTTNGAPITGTVTGVFQILRGGSLAGGGVVVHSETNVFKPDSSGVFSVVIGSVSPVAPSALADGSTTNRYLEARVLYPVGVNRQQLLAVPYAIEAYGSVPVGGVIMWWGDRTAKPANFELCDGNPVTTPGSPLLGRLKPNLLNRFPRGADNDDLSSSNLTTGGSNDLPAHYHGLGSVTATTVVAAAPAKEEVVDPGHHHDYNQTVDGNSFGDNSTDQKRRATNTTTNKTGVYLSHTPHGHGAATRIEGLIGNTNASWNGDAALPGGNQPAYQELFFIIRVK